MKYTANFIQVKKFGYYRASQIIQKICKILNKFYGIVQYKRKSLIKI